MLSSALQLRPIKTAFEVAFHQTMGLITRLLCKLWNPVAFQSALRFPLSQSIYLKLCPARNKQRLRLFSPAFSYLFLCHWVSTCPSTNRGSGKEENEQQTEIIPQTQEHLTVCQRGLLIMNRFLAAKTLTSKLNLFFFSCVKKQWMSLVRMYFGGRWRIFPLILELKVLLCFNPLQ